MIFVEVGSVYEPSESPVYLCTSSVNMFTKQSKTEYWSSKGCRLDFPFDEKKYYSSSSSEDSESEAEETKPEHPSPSRHTTLRDETKRSVPILQPFTFRVPQIRASHSYSGTSEIPQNLFTFQTPQLSIPTIHLSVSGISQDPPNPNTRFPKTPLRSESDKSMNSCGEPCSCFGCNFSRFTTSSIRSQSSS